MNLTFLTGIVPKELKIAKVIPIFKSGNASSFNNYRPISILPVFSKILEKVIAKKLIAFLEKTDQFYKHQYGFRPGHSTTHPVLQLVNQIAEENDKATKNLTITTFLDLSKAFDTISHKILLPKLDNFGVRGITNTWFKNYLSERTQYMDIYGIKSTLQDIICGVPQGSILGPILFILYINDIYKSTSLLTLCFADDTTISFSSSNIPELFRQMNLELYNLNQWFRANKLCLNINKTKYIIFGPTISQQIKSFPDLTLMIDNQRIDRIGRSEKSKSFKFLGIYIDENLSWQYHFEKICAKISRANYMINKVKHLASCLPKNIIPNNNAMPY